MSKPITDDVRAVPLAAELVRRADVSPGMDCLEPSAGDGAIVAELLAEGAIVFAVELLEENREKLEVFKDNGRFSLRPEKRFEEMPSMMCFDRIVMNPPFDFEVEHVTKAIGMLKPGGKLVAVMSAGVKFRSDKATTALREFIHDYGTIQDNPSSSFKESGTDVNTVTVVVSMP